MECSIDTLNVYMIIKKIIIIKIYLTFKNITSVYKLLIILIS